MDVSPNIGCPSPFTFGTCEDAPEAGLASGAQAQERPALRKRRPSHFKQRRKSLVNQFMEGEEGLLLKLDLLLTNLEKKLEDWESYGELSLDSGISAAYSTLQAVQERCSQVSEEMMGAGRRKLHVMVETLESGYQDALAAAESLNEKAKIGIEVLDDLLEDMENQVSKFRERGLANAAEVLMDEAHRVVDGGIERAMRAAESLEDHVQRAITRAREHGLLHYEDLPIPWRINPHIKKGYRFSETKLSCVRSAFSFSNELVNIWSHALGLVLVLAVAFYFYPTSTNFSLSSKADIFVAAVFFFAACQCLVCSTIWHTMNSVADVDLISMFACVDYTGISLLIASSIMTTEYTAFYCDPVSRYAYMITTALLGVGGVILPWHPKFNRQDMAWARVAFYCGLGATGFLPILQISLTRSFASAVEFYTPIGKSIGVYFLGAIVYASKVPERWCPGMFDYCGGSHNLWHIAVLGGILFHYKAMQAFFSHAFALAQDGCAVY
ncbi:hemolysin-III related-domain-containing protein [Triangularia verruculosa]|uniref:Hemolysin-III related-domain-containing protein n=1 Tax=Triangularia verruculosa TaxID=2587418 RepID=A0AAN7AWM7_9PEZI|nr:hemolysin-III related-domain-containing protein [Triangularia verruculosa]